VDGAKTVTLKGENIAAEFQSIVERYVASRYAKGPGPAPAQNQRDTAHA
jgi:(E)-4-hydroxy-3-methylbut-2-enyl-diphosphate synthase